MDLFHDQVEDEQQEQQQPKMGTRVHLPMTNKKRNLDSFMEELKQQQEAREIEKILKNNHSHGHNRKRMSNASSSSGYITSNRSHHHDGYQNYHHKRGRGQNRYTDEYEYDAHNHDKYRSVITGYYRKNEDYDGRGKRAEQDEDRYTNKRQDSLHHHHQNSSIKSHQNQEIVKVKIPKDKAILSRVHLAIQYVLKYGPLIESWIMYKYPEWFQFLGRSFSDQHFVRKDTSSQGSDFEFNSIDQKELYVYYKWKLQSLAQGGNLFDWSLDVMDIQGIGLVKPPHYLFYETEHRLPSKQEFSDISDFFSDQFDSNTKLSSSAKKKRQKKYMMDMKQMRPKYTNYLISHLRKLTMDKAVIGDLMVFCLDHVEAAEQIVSIIVQSLLNYDTPVFPTKISRLYLISDILHNSSIPLHSVWKYRLLFEQQLDEVWIHFGELWWKAFQVGRLRADYLKRVLMQVMDMWSEWMIYTEDVIQRFRKMFEVYQQAHMAAAFEQSIANSSSDDLPKQQQQSSPPLLPPQQQRIDGEEEDVGKLNTNNAKFVSISQKEENLDHMQIDKEEELLSNVKSTGFVPIDAINPETPITQESQPKIDDNHNDDDGDLDGKPFKLSKNRSGIFNLTKIPSLIKLDHNEVDEHDEDVDGIPLTIFSNKKTNYKLVVAQTIETELTSEINDTNEDTMVPFMQ